MTDVAEGAGWEAVVTWLSGRPRLIDALFPVTRQRVLGLLFREPGRSLYATEIIGAVAGGSGAVQRELARLQEAGLLVTRSVGNRKHFEINQSAALYEPLARLVRAAIVLPSRLAESLTPVRHQIDLAFVHGPAAGAYKSAAGAYGSAAGAQASGVDEQPAASAAEQITEIDFLVVSDVLDGTTLKALLEPAARALGQRIAVVVYTRAEFSARTSRSNTVLARVLGGPITLVVGGGFSGP